MTKDNLGSGLKCKNGHEAQMLAGDTRGHCDRCMEVICDKDNHCAYSVNYTDFETYVCAWHENPYLRQNQPQPDNLYISDELREGLAELVEQHFPKGKCKERGQAMVLVAYAEMLATQLIDRARVEELEIWIPELDDNIGTLKRQMEYRIATLKKGGE